jgi:hypothetical protein
MATALLVRALMGLGDAIALAQGGVRTLPLAGGIGLGATSPLWSALLALLALVGAVGLVVRWPMGWLVALGACVGYLISGLGDLAFVASAASLDLRDYAVLGVANVGVPAVVLSGLAWTRPSCAGRACWAARSPRVAAADLARPPAPRPPHETAPPLARPPAPPPVG